MPVAHCFSAVLANMGYTQVLRRAVLLLYLFDLSLFQIFQKYFGNIFEVSVNVSHVRFDGSQER